MKKKNNKKNNRLCTCYSFDYLMYEMNSTMPR